MQYWSFCVGLSLVASMTKMVAFLMAQGPKTAQEVLGGGIFGSTTKLICDSKFATTNWFSFYTHNLKESDKLKHIQPQENKHFFEHQKLLAISENFSLLCVLLVTSL